MEIFRQISDLVTGSEFMESSYMYMSKHVDVFDDDEENKLEYTPIFEEYVKILEKIIDYQLYQNYSKE